MHVVSIIYHTRRHQTALTFEGHPQNKVFPAPFAERVQENAATATFREGACRKAKRIEERSVMHHVTKVEPGTHVHLHPYCRIFRGIFRMFGIQRRIAITRSYHPCILVPPSDFVVWLCYEPHL